MSGEITSSIFDGDDDARKSFEALESEFAALDDTISKENSRHESIEETNTASMLVVSRRISRFVGRNSIRLYTRPLFARVRTKHVDGHLVRTTTHAKSKTIGRLSTPGSEMGQFTKTGERHFSIARTLLSLGILGFALSNISAPILDGDQPSIDDVMQIIKDNWPGEDA